MHGPWYFRFFLIFLFLMLAHQLPALGWLLIGIAAIIVLTQLLLQMQCLPRISMDVLKRLTNKDKLEKQFEQQQRQTLLIDAEELASYLKSKVIGQDHVADSVAAQLRRRFAARRKDRPVAVFCFAGPPGVGKSYFAKILCEKLYGDQKFLQFFDMSQYSQPHAAASMFGQAKGYVGSNTYGSLTASLRDFPNSIVLLDEFEKAHPEVHKRFLTAWNDGFVTEVSDGSKVSTDGAVFILTTNAAARKLGELGERYTGSEQDLSDAIKRTLEEAHFAPEVLSRIDTFFAFRTLQGLDIARVVALEIEKVVHQYQLELAEGGIDAEILLGAIERHRKTHANGGGVREIARAIEHQISDAVIDAKTAGAKAISLMSDQDNIRVVIHSHHDADEPRRLTHEPSGSPASRSTTSAESRATASPDALNPDS